MIRSLTAKLPRAVVEVRVPRRPGAVEGERQLLMVLVLLTPHPQRLEHSAKPNRITQRGTGGQQGPYDMQT